jgi:putative nucleotidyltransferase with HDIG domain
MKKPLDLREFLSRIKKTIPPTFRGGPAYAAVGAFLVSLTAVLLNMNSGTGSNLENFEAGKVADQDVAAEQAVTYEDEEATRLRRESQERQVPAVFRYSYKAAGEIKNTWKRFANLAEGEPADAGEEGSPDEYIRLIQENYAGDFSADTLGQLFQNPRRRELLYYAGLILDSILENGIYSLPSAGLDKLNQNTLELIRQSDSRIERELVSLEGIVTRENMGESLDRQISAGSFTPAEALMIFRLLEPFLSENVFYSPEDTVQRIIETRAKVEPVMKYIERGKKIIKKGFIITEADMEELRALNMSLPGSDARTIAARILLLFLVFIWAVMYCTHGVLGRQLTNAEVYLVCILSALYITGTVVIRSLFSGADAVVLAVVIPTALVIMLPSILINSRLALFLAAALPLSVFLSGACDAASFTFSIISGVTGSFVLHGAEKRMDLIRAGLITGAVNCAAVTAILLNQRYGAGAYPGFLFWAAFNGLASGMLVLGLLPPLEHALNAATIFRLIELSDLNAPILRRLFTAAPGTYSHSIMVANLAEAACQDIGANALLARVGAYYHDLGKMENPEYFVENQTDHNKHDDISPRLSATVIRSHVKLGIEKARALGLPREVIDIMGEHHGNSVIAWFYNKALKQEGGEGNKSPVNMEDFMYPGNPPHSRESAVVMLADMTEAAVRTLDRPTVARLEKFIQELINAKVEHGQLAQSELTFRDLETIKNALSGFW